MRKVKIFPTLVDSLKMYLNTDFIELDEIIDRINRVDKPIPEAALRGMALNDLIDGLIDGQQYEVKTVKNVACYVKDSFTFNKHICDSLARFVRGSNKQVFTKSSIMFGSVEVELYGFADYVNKNRVIDLKGTKRYSFPKYIGNFQHKCYLYTLRREGIEVDEAVYLITDYSNIYQEVYPWSDSIIGEIKSDLSIFLDFVDRHRSRITNKNLLY